MNKEFLESLAKCLEKFISDEVEKRCKKLEDEKNAAERNSQRYKRWLLFLIKDNSINLDKLYEEAERESREWEESDAHNGVFGMSKERIEADDRTYMYQCIKKFKEIYEDA